MEKTMNNLRFSSLIKKCLQVVLLLTMLFFNFGTSGVGVAHVAGNDLIADAVVISSLPYAPGALDTTAMHTENTDPNPYDYAGGCEGFNLRNGLATVWYKYAPGTSTPVYLDTSGSTTTVPNPNDPPNFYEYDTYIAVYTSSDGTSTGILTLAACNDNPANATNQAQLAFTANAGTTYFSQVE